MHRKIITLIVILVIPFVSWSQPGGPGGGGDPDVPISGIEYLIAGGALLGIQKFLRKGFKKRLNG